MRKSWRVFHDRSLLLRSFWSFLLQVMEYCSAVWCSAADSHLKLLDRVTRSASLLAGGVLECNLAHRRSIEVLCVLFKIKSNPMHPLSGALPLPYVPALVTRGVWLLIGTSLRLLAVELLSIAGPLCPTQYRYGTILVTLFLMVWDWRVLRAEPTPTCWLNLFFLYISHFFSLFLPSTDWFCEVGVLGLIGCSHSLPALHCGLFFNNNNEKADI